MAHAASEPGAEPSADRGRAPGQGGVDSLDEAVAAGTAPEEARIAGALIAPEALVSRPILRRRSLTPPTQRFPLSRGRRRRPGRAATTERRRRTGARNGATPVASPDPGAVEPTACCPYCAVLLERPPETDDRCPRCHQRMIVRSVGARVAILAEAVLPFFEAERLNEEALGP